ncbi:hypothetical protein FA95DRAFT_823896 [Auriscalpium vulgare]|uniref:Uncharacterized protein n=1 Tax=Auriscalpium vulgare TaxID=40419 RepID=A0ACB8R9W2_9AGAM|nr:hypothetical protein FA95DRAFT_823896 [Auriscalpium vulgare]
MLFSLTAASLFLLPSVHAFWRMPCTKPVVDGRYDPIVSPGVVSSHAHTIMGGKNIGVSSTFDTMRESDCTTCKVKDDLSAYWVPQLYYEFPNKTYASVDHGGMLVYYLQRNAANETVQAFPDGLRMVTGNPYLRNFTNTPEANAISWLCLDYSQPGQAQTPGFTNTNCPDGLRMQVFFPGCWNGKDLDSADHKSHMAYPDGIDNGLCPPTHPIHLISIFYELYYSVDPFNKLNDGGRFVLANGDPTGYGSHGDFLNGWDSTVLSRAVQTCTNLSGVIEDCPVFENEGRLLTDDQNNACNAADPNAERVDGAMPFLPGCVPVTDGPAPAQAGQYAAGCTINGVAPGGVAVSASAAQAPSSAATPASSTVKVTPSSSAVRAISADPATSSAARAASSAHADQPTSAAPAASSAHVGEPTSAAPAASSAHADQPTSAAPASPTHPAQASSVELAATSTHTVQESSAAPASAHPAPSSSSAGHTTTTGHPASAPASSHVSAPQAEHHYHHHHYDNKDEGHGKDEDEDEEYCAEPPKKNGRSNRRSHARRAAARLHSDYFE